MADKDTNTLPVDTTASEQQFERVEYMGWSSRRGAAMARKNRRDNMAEIRAQRSRHYAEAAARDAVATQEPAPAAAPKSAPQPAPTLTAQSPAPRPSRARPAPPAEAPAAEPETVSAPDEVAAEADQPTIVGAISAEDAADQEVEAPKPTRSPVSRLRKK